MICLCDVAGDFEGIKMAFRGMAVEFEDIQGRQRRLGFGGTFSDRYGSDGSLQL